MGQPQHWGWVQIRQGQLQQQTSFHSNHSIHRVYSNLCILPSVLHTHSTHTRGQLQRWRWGQIRQGQLHQQISFQGPQFLPDLRQGPFLVVVGGFFVVLLVVGGKLLGQLTLVCGTHVFLFTVSVGPTL